MPWGDFFLGLCDGEREVGGFVSIIRYWREWHWGGGGVTYDAYFCRLTKRIAIMGCKCKYEV